MKKILLFLFITAYSFGQFPTDELKRFTFLNGLQNDANPGTYDMQVSSGSPTFTTGIESTVQNSALDFVGGQSLSFGNIPYSSVNALSLSFWIKTNVNNANVTRVLDHGLYSIYSGLSLYLKDGKINAAIKFDNGQTANIYGSTVISNNQWVHVTYNAKGTGVSGGIEVKLYVNGVADSTPYNYSFYSSGADYFKDSYTTKVNGLNPSVDFGAIDNIRFYTRGLNDSEITALANENSFPYPNYYLDPNATGNNDGTSWQDAFTDLNSVLASFIPGKEIWLRAGTYIPTTINTDPRKATFNLPNGVKIYGGFNGTETDKSQRNPSANPTILSGDLNGNDNSNITNTETTRQDNAYHVVSIRGNASNIIVDGITISGGNANGGQLTTGAASSQYYDIRGGAIYVNPFNANDVIMATFNNCILEKNSGTNVGVYSYYNPTGVVDMYTDVDFKNCIIRDNFSAGLANFIFFGSNGYQIENNGSIENCLFYNNASAQSSAIYLGTSTSAGGNTNSLELNIINSTFAKNNGNNGNVITFANVSPSLVNIKNTIIYDNGSSTPFNLSSGSYPTFYNSIGVPATQGGTNGNLNTDPLFTDANNFDFTLQSGSSAIDSGNNSYVTVSEDLLGNSRIFNGTVDRGAYEYGSTLSNDSFTNENDYKVFPNPVQNELNIQSDSEIEKIEIYSLEGKLMLQSNAKIINVHSLENGIYILKITDFNGHKKIKKIIKK